jgi:hypothetical protein
MARIEMAASCHGTFCVVHAVATFDPLGERRNKEAAKGRGLIC